MIVIMNPPYGKSSSLAKKILKIIPQDFYTVSLQPLNTWKDEVLQKRLSNLVKIDNTKNLFEGASFSDFLSIAVMEKDAKGVDLRKVFLNEKQEALYDAIQKYNATQGPSFVAIDGNNFKKKFQCPIPDLNKVQWKLNSDWYEKKFSKRLDEFFSPKSEGIFVKTVWCSENGVHFGDSHDSLYNYGKKDWDTNWEKDRRVDVFLFATEVEKINFRDWWYSITKKEVTKCRKGLTNAFLDLNHLYEGSGVEDYLNTFPHLDWSHSWTDEEIIAELKDKAGLPEDWRI